MSPSPQQRSRPTRVLFLTSGNRTPSTRFRILPFLSPLRAAGIRCSVASSFPQKYDYFPWLGFRPSQFLKRIVRWGHLCYSKLRRFDTVVIERELFNDDTMDMEQRFRRIARRLVLDLDDAVFLRFPEKIENLVRMSDLVIAGNSWIANYVATWNSNIVVIPTGIQLAKYPVKDAGSNNPLVIGWIGTTGNLPYLEVAGAALRNLAQHHRFELRIIVPELTLPPTVDFRGMQLNHVKWNGATEVEELRKFDIGIMPLFSTKEWDKYKCPTKLIQCMAAGIPAVASKIGFTGDVLTHGHDGLYATSDDEWQSSLALLLTDAELRKRIGSHARTTAAEKYSVEANWPILFQALDGTDPK